MPTASLEQKLATLTQQVETLSKRRAEAAAVYKLAQKQLGEVDAAIRAIGFDPEMSDEALAGVEQTLEAEVEAALRLVEQEGAQIDAVLAAAKQAGLV